MQSPWKILMSCILSSKTGAGSGGAAASCRALPCPFAEDGEDLGMLFRRGSDPPLPKTGNGGQVRLREMRATAGELDRRSEGQQCQERDQGRAEARNLRFEISDGRRINVKNRTVKGEGCGTRGLCRAFGAAERAEARNLRFEIGDFRRENGRINVRNRALKGEGCGIRPGMTAGRAATSRGRQRDSSLRSG